MQKFIIVCKSVQCIKAWIQTSFDIHIAVSSFVSEQCTGEQKDSIWPVVHQKIELIVVGQCSMMSEMSWGLGLCVHRHSPWAWKGSAHCGVYKRELCSGIGMAR